MPTIHDLKALLEDGTVLSNLVVSVLLLVSVAVVRSGAMKWVRGAQWSNDDDRLRWNAMVRRSAVGAVLLGLLLIWGSELKTLAVSIVAIAAALVLATKELMMCLTGGILRASARSFSLGSRVEIGGARGDVIDCGAFTTTIREIGPGHQWTGRAVVIPNSVFLTTQVINETYTQEFVLHLISIPILQSDDPDEAEKLLLSVAEEACAEFIEEAKAHMDRIADEQGVPAPNTSPRVTFEIPDAGKLNLLVRFPAPAREKGRIEQQIVRRFVDRSAAPESDPTG